MRSRRLLAGLLVAPLLACEPVHRGAALTASFTQTIPYAPADSPSPPLSPPSPALQIPNSSELPRECEELVARVETCSAQLLPPSSVIIIHEALEGMRRSYRTMLWQSPQQRDTFAGICAHELRAYNSGLEAQPSCQQAATRLHGR